ncbi:NAD-dependent epimerase [Pigmentiphaga humi]|nr:NAD-dependent epimerase [Pigmentiphaga humi]
MKILLTGAAGFIGMHTALRLLDRGDEVIGVDNLNDYYEVALKESRLSRLLPHPGFSFLKLNVEDREGMSGAFSKEKPERVIHLAAQAGVRYSLQNPYAYIDANLQGFLNILEGCRAQNVEHLAYASSSSVYGGNTALPFSEHQNIDHPVSLYAATKKANELMAHTYSHLFQIPTSGLRFFTVYGPWGRPDMALFIFTRAILEGRPIDIFNNGLMTRDFTYIDDIVEGVIRVIDKPAERAPEFDPSHPDPAISNAPYRVFNIGNMQPTPLMDYVHALEEAIGIEAKKNYLPMQPGDVPATAADTSELDKWVGFKPNTPVKEGVRRFVEWYRQYYNIL